MPDLFGTQSVRVTLFFRINWKWCKDKLHDLSTMTSEMIKNLSGKCRETEKSCKTNPHAQIPPQKC